MSKNKQNENQLVVTPDMLWNKSGLIQQLIVFIFLLIIYTTVIIILHRSPKPHLALNEWFTSLKGLFISSKWYWDIILGVIVGTILSHILMTFDIFVAWILKKDIPKWIHRADHLFPRTKTQKKHALIISLIGSTQEEVLFRAYILLAILPLWSHWIWSALILSTIFALFHAGLQGFWATLWIFITSIILCASIALGKSIYFVSAIHIMININNLILIPLIYYKKKLE